jgi:agmatinase
MAIMTTDMRGADRLNRAYTGIPTFLRADHAPDPLALEGGIAVLGVPFDEGSPFMPGARFGPRSIREHSLRFGPSGIVDFATGQTWLRKMIAERRIADLGDVDVRTADPDSTMAALTGTIRAIRGARAMPLVLGGDHTVTYPVLRGYDEPIHVVQLDAHLDYGQEPDGMVWTNGQGFRMAYALPNVQSLTMIGIRSPRGKLEDFQRAKAEDVAIATMPDWRARGPEGVIAHIPAGAPAYVSIDIDVFDMSLIPGCVSGEPGGPDWDMVRATLLAIATRLDVVGFDLVEVNPMLDVGTGATSYLGALTAASFLGFVTGAD